MNLIGKTISGDIIASITPDDVLRLSAAASAGRLLAELVDGLKQLPGSPEFLSAPQIAPLGPGNHRLKPQLESAHRARGPAKGTSVIPERKLKSDEARNKKCVICQAGFRDDSRTNSRKTCAKQECARELVLLTRRSRNWNATHAGTGTKPRQARSAPTPTAAVVRDKTCIICADSFRDNSRRNTRRICLKESCAKEMQRRYRADWARKHKRPGPDVKVQTGGGLPAPRPSRQAGGGSGSSLADEQKAARLKLINDACARTATK